MIQTNLDLDELTIERLDELPSKYSMISITIYDSPKLKRYINDFRANTWSGSGKNRKWAGYNSENMSNKQLIKAIYSFIDKSTNMHSNEFIDFCFYDKENKSFPKMYEILSLKKPTFPNENQLQDYKTTSFGRNIYEEKPIPQIQKSDIPVRYKAHKTTPKRKYGIAQLENSVRRMF